MHIRFLGHVLLRADRRRRQRADRPVPDRQPEGGRSTADEVNPTHILLTHGHQDHYGDTVDIAKRTGAQVVTMVEIAGELAEHGLETSRTRTSAARSSSTGAG